MTPELLTGLFGCAGTLVGGGVTWGVAKVQIKVLMDSMDKIVDWKEGHERWCGKENTARIKEITTLEVKTQNLETIVGHLEKRDGG